MDSWSVAADARHLLRGGRDDFLLLDTLWSALHRAEVTELATVAELRAAQGFSGALFSLLPLANDHSGALPEVLDGDLRLRDEYVAHVRAGLQEFTNRGLVPAVVLSWVCWLPQTWSSRAPMTLDAAQLSAIAAQAVEALADLQPIWVLSGDDAMTSTAALACYLQMAEVVRQRDPGALLSAHTGAFVNLPQPLLEAIDLVAFQSGHEQHTWSSMPQAWNHHLAGRAPRIPAINAEPAYEGHGWGSGRGRHDVAHVRRAAWSSVLTGAGAGVGYGAHGLWCWHRAGDPFTSVEWSSMPFDAMDALHLPGAWDMGWLRTMAIDLRCWELEDRTDLLIDERTGAVAGGDTRLDRIVVYAPVATELTVMGSGHTVRCWDVERREPCPLQAWPIADGRQVRIALPARNGPHLYLLER